MNPEQSRVRGSFSLLRVRSLLRLRRRSDKVWFAAGLLSMSFSASVLVYKLRFEPLPAAVQRQISLPQEEPETLPAPAVEPEPAPPPAPVRKKEKEKEKDEREEKEKEKERAERKKPASKPAPASKAKASAKEPVKEPAPPPPPKAAGKLLDACESAAGWVQAAAQDASLRAAAEPGWKGNALVLHYSMPAGKWVAVRKRFPLSLKQESAFVLRVRAEGRTNNLEFKVTDKDGSNFGKIFPEVAPSGSWRQVRIPVSELKYLWGGDRKLDMGAVEYLDIAVSGPGGEGKILLDDIRLE